MKLLLKADGLLRNCKKLFVKFSSNVAILVFSKLSFTLSEFAFLADLIKREIPAFGTKRRSNACRAQNITLWYTK